MQERNNVRICRFSMVELLVALIVIAVGIISVLGLFPVGTQNNRDATSVINAGDAAQQFMTFLTSSIRNDDSMLDAIPLTKPGNVENNYDWSNASVIESNNTIIRFATANAGDLFNPSVHQTGIFKLEQVTSGNMADFKAAMRVWKKMVSAGASGDLVQLSVEVSYPIDIPYDKRQSEYYKTEIFMEGTYRNVLKDFDPCTVWSVEGAVPKLKYYTLSDVNNLENTVGDIDGISGAVDVEALTISSDGTLYFINQGTTSKLYLIEEVSIADVIDGLKSKVEARLVGDTGLNGNDRVRALQFVDNELYAVAQSSKKLYRVNTDTASTALVANLSMNDGTAMPGSFDVGGMTVGADDFVYIVRSLNSNSEIWRFDDFEAGKITQVVTLAGSGSTGSLAAHPSGYMVAADSSKFFRINADMTFEDQVAINNQTEATDFYYRGESAENACAPDNTVVLGGTINLNPSNSPQNEFYLVFSNGTRVDRDDLHDFYPDTTGNAVEIFFKPKGNGNQNGMTVNGSAYEVLNKNRYLLEAGDITFSLYNDKRNKSGKAMGHWWIDISANGATITVNP